VTLERRLARLEARSLSIVGGHCADAWHRELRPFDYAATVAELVPAADPAAVLAPVVDRCPSCGEVRSAAVVVPWRV
jgi:hypothetical protein